MPNLLVAPTEPTAEASPGNGELVDGQESGYYADGAYTALPVQSSNYMDAPADYGEDEDVDPQEAYYTSLTDRFFKLRTLLDSSPPPDSSPNEVSHVSAQANFLHGATHHEWRYALLHTVPSMRVLSSMHQTSIIRGLGRLETLLTRRNLLSKREGEMLGAWSWGLLGKCRDAGQMVSEEIAVLRMLGKTAVKVSRKMRIQKRRSEESDEKEGEEEEDDDDQEDEEETEDNQAGCEEVAAREERVEEEVEEGELADDAEIPEAPSPDSRDNMYKAQHSLPDESPLLRNGLSSDNMAFDPIDEPKSATHSNHEAYGEPSVDSGIPIEERSIDPLTVAKASLLAKVRSPAPVHLEEISDGAEQDEYSRTEARAFATLDMLVTIVGEIYGQRDLLNAREVWGE